MSDEWLAAARRHAEWVASQDERHAITDMERIAIQEAAIILRLLDEIERHRAERAAGSEAA